MTNEELKSKLLELAAKMKRRSDEAYKGQTGWIECWGNQIEYDEPYDWAVEIEKLLGGQTPLAED